ncbi:MAG: hypothetical protein H0Z28_12955, partial [Archaeoglobus sp.]|nr:hypothetical protein [Archaeoglobus sp.]
MKRMPRLPTLQDLKKKWRIRFHLGSIFLIAWLITDELVKEGYAFDPADVVYFGTHEFWIVILLAINVAVLGQRWLRRG